MVMTKQGGENLRRSQIAKYGSEEAWKAHMRELGKVGGASPASKPKGFAANKELARIAGKKGGRNSRQGRK